MPLFVLLLPQHIMIEQVKVTKAVLGLLLCIFGPLFCSGSLTLPKKTVSGNKIAI
jgi:hypothetical protein